jgi:hypothetical protein
MGLSPALRTILLAQRPSLALNFLNGVLPQGVTASGAPSLDGNGLFVDGSVAYTITGSDFSCWFNPSEGTFVVEFSRPVPAANSFVLEVSDGTFNEVMALYTDAANMIFNVRDGGVGQAAATLVSGVGAAGQIYKQALAYRANDFAGASNGGTPLADLGGSLPTPTHLRLGSFSGGGQPLGGYIRSLKFYRTRLPNSTLQRLTA